MNYKITLIIQKYSRCLYSIILWLVNYFNCYFGQYLPASDFLLVYFEPSMKVVC